MVVTDRFHCSVLCCVFIHDTGRARESNRYDWSLTLLFKQFFLYQFSRYLLKYDELNGFYEHHTERIDRYILIKINSMGPSDAIWRHKRWALLVQVMTSCLHEAKQRCSKFRGNLNQIKDLCHSRRCISIERAKTASMEKRKVQAIKWIPDL